MKFGDKGLGFKILQKKEPLNELTPMKSAQIKVNMSMMSSIISKVSKNLD